MRKRGESRRAEEGQRGEDEREREKEQGTQLTELSEGRERRTGFDAVSSERLTVDLLAIDTDEARHVVQLEETRQDEGFEAVERRRKSILDVELDIGAT